MRPALPRLIYSILEIILCCGTGLAQSQTASRPGLQAPNPSATTSLWPQSGLGLLLNVVGGILTVLAVEAWKHYQRRWQAREFKRVYGDAASSCSLVYGSLSLHDRTRKAVNSNVVLPLKDRAELLLRPLGKPTDAALTFSAERIASASEVRCASYLAESLSRYVKISASVVSDESIAEKIDVNFVSFGVLNNQKTMDAFSNPTNTLARYDSRRGIFVAYSSGNWLHPNPSELKDYGIILKIHPEQFKNRSWIACAGVGEWGTSGAAWFLSHKWRDLSRHLRSSDQSFLAVIEVVRGQDESALMIAFGTPDQPIPGSPPATAFPGSASNCSATVIRL